MKKTILDVEVYRNVFLCSVKDYDTKEITTWEISERINQYDEIKKWCNNYKDFLITFNGIHYDVPMLLFLIQNNFEDWQDCTNQLKNWSDKLIGEDRWWSNWDLKKYKYHNKWLDIDLMLYWSKMLRLSKKLSLKGLAVQLNYPTIQELPYSPDSILRPDEIDELIRYNSIHDLGITELLMEKLTDEIRLRCSIYNEYKLKCFSWDAPKIATEVLAQSYAEQTFNPEKKVETYGGLWKYQTLEEYAHEIKNLHFSKPTLKLGELLSDFNPNFELPIFQKLYKDICNSTDSFGGEVNVIENNTAIKLSYGIGGLHSVNKNEIYKSDDNNIIVTSDFASLYPNLIINYSLIRFPEVLQRYKDIKEGRIQAKKEGNKSKDTLYKLVLNSTSGMLDNQYSWLYYPEGAMKLRLIGQLILTKLAEKCIVAGYKVVSCNTDGIELLLSRGEYPHYLQLAKEVEEQFNLVLEHDFYSKIVYSSVNDYIAITEGGKIKQKGLFVTQPVLSNSVDFLVIPKALEAYYVKGIEPSTFIKGHANIFDFCAAQKTDRSYTVVWNDQKQQRLNRYYVSKNAPYLYKEKGGKRQHMLKDYGVQLYNNHKEIPIQDYKIDYDFYINKVMTVIIELRQKNQLKLF